MKQTFVIDGGNIRDIPSFYDELNRVFMAGEDWQLGASLDALNDMLHGGYGAIRGSDSVEVVWHDHEQSRAALGLETTRGFYLEKLKREDMFDVDRIGDDLAALNDGTGPTYFEIILEIFADHPDIELVLR